MRLAKIFRYAGLPALLPVSLCCQAGMMAPGTELSSASEDNSSGLPLAVHIYTSLLNNNTDELVYSDGETISRLKWQSRHVLMAGAGLSLRMTDRITLNAGIATDTGIYGATMDDYDWLWDDTDEWSNWSHHSDTDVDSILLFDLSMNFRLWQYRSTSVQALLGLRRSDFSWSAAGGDYIYSEDDFRDSSGSFTAGEKVISYEQTSTAGYLGAGLQSELYHVHISGELLFAPWVSMKATDTHYLRNLKFTDHLENGYMLGGNVSLSYPLTSHLDLGGSFFYQKYADLSGGTTEENTLTGSKVYYSGKAAGASNETWSTSLSLSYRF